MMFKLGKRSLERLQGVRSPLINVIDLAIKSSAVDFTVIQGLRTLEEQRQNVASGASQTMNSKHLTGDAVDLAAWVDGAINWHEKHYFHIAEAMRKAALDLSVPLIWGYAWNRNLVEYPTALAANKDYLAERKRLGKKPFADLGHFELI